MYSPTTRLLTVLELLQSYRQMSGPEIAQRLEVDVRTVRRYIVMLQDMGIPIEAERGPYGSYILQRGHRMPPLMLTDAEAVALTLGLLAIREYRFPVDVAAVEGALAKAERVMPAHLLEQVRSLQESIAFSVSTPPVAPQSELVAALSLAIHQHRRVRLTYRSWSGEESQRDVDPYGIVFNDGYWHSVGYCHLRQGMRTFRLDRMIALEATEQTFEPPRDFDVTEYVAHAVAFLPGAGAQEVEVLLETTIERARALIPPIMGTLEATAQGVVFRRTATQLDWVAHVLLTVDFPVHVIQPVELRDMLRTIAAKAQRLADEEANALPPLKERA